MRYYLATTRNLIRRVRLECLVHKPSSLDSLHRMGNPSIKTPNLDKFASEGIVFKNMIAGSSVCVPTRCCFLTGKHSGHTSDQSESKDLAAAKREMLNRLTSLAAKAHEPVREGSFASNDLHQRDRRAKFGKHDQADVQELTPKGKAKSK